MSVPLASSTVMTPSLLTFDIASAISLPMLGSLLAEMDATCSILAMSLPTTWLCSRSDSTTLATALSIPRLRSIGLAPAVTFFSPTPMSACARTVAVVVPSPALSLVFDATSRTICAPMLAIASSNSTSLATVTPSLVICGAPNFLSMMTLRPLGPSVTFTAFDSASTPSLSISRASTLYLISFAIAFTEFDVFYESVKLQRCQNIRLFHDEVVRAVDIDLRPGILAVEYLVADLDLHLDLRRTGAYGHDFACQRFFFRGVGNDKSARGLLLGGIRENEHSVR